MGARHAFTFWDLYTADKMILSICVHLSALKSCFHLLAALLTLLLQPLDNVVEGGGDGVVDLGLGVVVHVLERPGEVVVDVVVVVDIVVLHVLERPGEVALAHAAQPSPLVSQYLIVKSVKSDISEIYKTRCMVI